MNKTLNILESAYRATLEEQDDTILWIASAMRKAGADVDVLLSESAVNYAVLSQDSSGLALGAWKQAMPPELSRDIEAIAKMGAKVLVVGEDLDERGISRSELSPYVEPVRRSQLANLFAEYDRIWHW